MQNLLELIQQLRAQTNAAITHCKEALHAVQGDLEKAKHWLREKGRISAIKKVGLATGEGIIAAQAEGGHGVILELNTQTDFVPRNERFQAMATAILDKALHEKPASKDMLHKVMIGDITIENYIAEAIGTIGENIVLSRFASLNVQPGIVAAYVHNSLGPSMGKIGVLVGLESEAPQEALQKLGRALAMHIAACDPQYLTREEVPEDVLKREREIAIREAEEKESKIEKKMEQFYEMTVLEDQRLVTTPGKKIKKVIQEAEQSLKTSVRIAGVYRFAVGGGTQ